jgi:aspartokinase
MITIPEKVEELVNQSPYLREAMSDKLVNLSALARQLKPQIEKDLIKDVSESAVFIALQRYAATMKPYYQVNPADYLANLALRTDLFELTVKNSPALLAKLSLLAQAIDDRRTSLFVFTQGQHETTIITSKSLDKDLKAALKDETISTIPDLTGISLQRTHGQIETTGVLQFPLRILAWEGISVIEIITTLNEIMMVVRDFEVDRAVASIRQGLQTVKQQGAQHTAAR